jgi:hypothetical protein
MESLAFFQLRFTSISINAIVIGIMLTFLPHTMDMAREWDARLKKVPPRYKERAQGERSSSLFERDVFQKEI